MAINAALGTILLAAIGGQASAQDDQGLTFTTNVWVQPEICNAGIASPVDLQDLAQDPAAWNGKCVRVVGYWSHYGLYRNEEDARLDYDNIDDAFRGRRIGLYGKQVIHAADPGHSRFYTAVGVAGLCAELRAGLNIMQGYCVLGDGAYLATSAISLTEN